MSGATRKKIDVSKGAASVTLFCFGDSKYTTLFQETVKLKKGMEGYDYKVLLKHNETPTWLDLSEKDEKLADVVMPPTAANLKECLADVANAGYMIDLFVFSHGWKDKFKVSTGSHGSTGYFSADDIKALPAAAKLPQLPIRAVFQINCYAQTLNQDWLGIGAKTAAGARYVQFYANRLGHFADDWNKGNVSFDKAVQDSDTDAARTVVQTYISMVHAPSTKKNWGGCPFGKTVLGDSSCAKDYFLDQWLANDEWQKNESGKDNMNHSSFMFRAGEKTLTKSCVPSWS